MQAARLELIWGDGLKEYGELGPRLGCCALVETGFLEIRYCTLSFDAP